MLVTFSSSATSDLVMFGDVARELLESIGKTSGNRGSVMPDEFPQALERLGAIPGSAELEDGTRPLDDDPAEPVSLAVRAYPFINMLRQAGKEQVPILWHCASDFFAAA